MKDTWITISSCAVLAVSLSTVQATLIDFNTPGDLTANFQAVDSGKYSEAAGIGLGGTAGVEIATFGSQGSRTYTSESFSGSGTLSASIYFQWVTPTDVGFGSGMFLGFGPTTDYAPGLGGGSGDPSDNHVLVAVPGNAQMFIQNVSSGAAAQNSGFAGNTLVSGNWYHLQLDLSPTGGNDFDLTGTLTNSDSDGVLGTVVRTVSTNYTNSGLIGDAEVYAFFGGQGNSVARGIDALDNFSAIPEPSSLVLISVALGSLMMFRKRT